MAVHCGRRGAARDLSARISPIINESWLHGAVYGFGFVPRAEISQVADALRAASKPDDQVIAPSFICFEANRRELIRYPETYGVYREAKAEYERDGFFAARRRMGTADFFQLDLGHASLLDRPDARSDRQRKSLRRYQRLTDSTSSR